MRQKLRCVKRHESQNVIYFISSHLGMDYLFKIQKENEEKVNLVQNEMELLFICGVLNKLMSENAKSLNSVYVFHLMMLIKILITHVSCW